MYKKNLAENEHFIQDKDGKIIPMRYAQTEAEIKDLLEKFNNIYSVKIEKYDHREIKRQKREDETKRLNTFIDFCKKTNLLLPLKYLIQDIEEKEKLNDIDNESIAKYVLHDLYPLEDNVKVFIYFLQKVYDQNNPLKNGTDLSSWKIPKFLHFNVPNIRIKGWDNEQVVVNNFNKIIGEPLVHQEIKIDNLYKHYEEENGCFSKYPDNYFHMERDALYEFIEIISTLYDKQTIQQFVNSDKFTEFKEKLFSYYDPPDFDSHSKSATEYQIGLLLMYFLGKPDKYNFNL